MALTVSHRCQNLAPSLTLQIDARAKEMKAAGLDVWMDEKNPNWELAAHPAVSCLPHIGAGTKEAQKRIGAELVDIIRNF